MSEIGRVGGRPGPAARGRAEVEAVIQARSWQARAISLLRRRHCCRCIVLLVVVGTFVNSAFPDRPNFTGIGQQASALGVIVVGETLILLIGGMDLSLEGDLRPGADDRGLADRAQSRRSAAGTLAQPLPGHPVCCSPSAR